MTDDQKDKEHIQHVQDSTYCTCGRPKRYWHTQCEVCMSACQSQAPEKLEPKIKEGGGRD